MSEGNIEPVGTFTIHTSEACLVEEQKESRGLNRIRCGRIEPRPLGVVEVAPHPGCGIVVDERRQMLDELVGLTLDPLVDIDKSRVNVGRIAWTCNANVRRSENSKKNASSSEKRLVVTLHLAWESLKHGWENLCLSSDPFQERLHCLSRDSSLRQSVLRPPPV